MENNIKDSTEETVVNENENVVIEETKVVEDVIKKDEEGGFIPRSRLNEVIAQKNELKSKLEEIEQKLLSTNSEKEESIKTYQKEIEEIKNNLTNEVSTIKSKYEETLYKNSGVEDIEYLKFLTDKKVANGIELEVALKEIKEEKPNLFIENRKSVGEKPNSNTEGKFSKSEFSQIKDRSERMRIIREGLLLND